MKIILLVVLISILFTIPALSQSKKVWQETLSKNTVTEYTEFLKRYPYSKYSKRVVQIIDSLDWVLADSIGNINSYGLYLDKHKHGKFINDAMSNYVGLIVENSVPLTQIEIEKIKDELQLLAAPFILVELKYFFSKTSNSSGQFKKDFNTLEASYSSNQYSFKNVVRPNSSLFTHCLAYVDKVVILTTSMPLSMADFLNSENGIPSKELDPKKLFVLSNPTGDNIDSIGYSEIRIYEVNDEIREHLILINDKWSRVKK